MPPRARAFGQFLAAILRRHPVEVDELAYYLVHLREGSPLAEVARVAGTRWAIEDTFKLAKGQAGLDHYETRSWRGWHRHITLALWALAILAGEAARAKGARRRRRAARPAQRPRTAPPDGAPGRGPSRRRGGPLVPLAAPASSHRPRLPHQTPPRRPGRESVAAILGRIRAGKRHILDRESMIKGAFARNCERRRACVSMWRSLPNAPTLDCCPYAKDTE